MLFYTPLKRVTPQTTWIGAAAGATPPLVGWAAAAGSLPARAWALFAIMFLWQIPHFLALFWMYREDYARDGFRTAPVVDPRGGERTAYVPAYPVHGLIDIVGAGDSTNAGIACALVAGAGLEAAAAFGNLVASITIQQLGTTGTASPEQVRQRWREVRS